MYRGVLVMRSLPKSEDSAKRCVALSFYCAAGQVAISFTKRWKDRVIQCATRGCISGIVGLIW